MTVEALCTYAHKLVRTYTRTQFTDTLSESIRIDGIWLGAYSIRTRTQDVES